MTEILSKQPFTQPFFNTLKNFNPFNKLINHGVKGEDIIHTLFYTGRSVSITLRHSSVTYISTMMYFPSPYIINVDNNMWYCFNPPISLFRFSKTFSFCLLGTSLFLLVVTGDLLYLVINVLGISFF